MIASTFTDEVRDGIKVKTKLNKEEAEKQNQPPPACDEAATAGWIDAVCRPRCMTDQDMQGQNAKPQQKGGGGDKKSLAKIRGQAMRTFLAGLTRRPSGFSCLGMTETKMQWVGSWV